MQKGLVIIPAYNEELSIKKTIQAVKKDCLNMDILVVNDGSKDKTSAIAREEGAIVLDLCMNLGIGGAVQLAMIYAQQQGYEYVARIDADGQHNPSEIANLTHALFEREANFVIGSRFLGIESFRSTFLRRAGIVFFARLISLLVGYKITDPTSGFFVADKKAINLMAAYCPDDFPEPEMIVVFHKHNCKVIEVPTSMNKRESGHSSINMLKSLYYMVKVTVAIVLQSLKRVAL